jgi:hypothetical protein
VFYVTYFLSYVNEERCFNFIAVRFVCALTTAQNKLIRIVNYVVFLSEIREAWPVS